MSKHFHVPILLLIVGLALTYGGGYQPDMFGDESEDYETEFESAYAQAEQDLDLAYGDEEFGFEDEYFMEEEAGWEEDWDDEEPGAMGVVGALIGMLVMVGVRVGLGMAACAVTARLMVFDFSPWLSSALKLGAIFVFPAAVASYVPYAGWGVQFLLYYGLLSWLFEVGGTELHVFAGLIFLVNLLATVLGTVLVAGLIVGML